MADFDDFDHSTMSNAPLPSDPPPAVNIPGFPVNRIIVFLGPYIAVASGGAAAWLSQNFPGLIDDPNEAAAVITQGATFIAGTIVTWALQHKYLDGWQQWEGYHLDVARQQVGVADQFPAWATHHNGTSQREAPRRRPARRR